MKVYIVMANNCESSQIVQVFSNRKLAESFAENIPKKYLKRFWWANNFSVIGNKVVGIE